MALGFSLSDARRLPLEIVGVVRRDEWHASMERRRKGAPRESLA